jgi:Zn-dependent metalloprotease
MRHFHLAVAAALALAGAPAHALVRSNEFQGIPQPAPLTSVPSDAEMVGGAAALPVAAPVRDLRALTALQNASHTPFTAQWDAASGHVRVLSAGRSRAYTGEPVAAARQFLAEARPLLGAATDPATLAVVGTRSLPDGVQVAFQQQMNGVPVLGHAVSVTLNAAGEVTLAENTTAEIGQVETTPTVSAVRAAAEAQGEIIELPALAIKAGGMTARLVWRFTCQEAGGKPVRVTVDAHSGRTLERKAMVLAATGQGNVYRGNPVATPNREMLDLTFLDGYGKLQGPYTKSSVYQVTGSQFTPYQSVNNPALVYAFGANTIEQSQVQAYYGISSIHDYFKSTFNFTLRDKVIPAFVRWPDEANAYYTPSTTIGGLPTPYGYMMFGYAGTPGYPVRDFALDNDVLYHEYTHAVMDVWSPAFSNASYDDYDRGGIGEGVADYFSSSFLNDPALGEYSGQAYGQSPLRDLRGKWHFPEEIVLKATFNVNGVTYSNVRIYPEVHQTGEIWGPALWDLRVMLGTTKADQIIFRGMKLLNATTTLQTALTALLAADDALYGGVNKPVIKQVLNARGITEDVYPIKYLDDLAFYSETGASKVQIGMAWKGTDGVAYISTYDTYPSYNVGQNYFFSGYVDDPAVKTVAFVLRNASNTVVDKIILPVKTLLDGFGGTFHYFTQSAQFSPSVIPAGQTALTGLRLSVQSYTQVSTTVTSSFSSLTPKATAPISPTVYPAQLIVPQTTPVLLPPGFGDTDGNGTVALSDGILVLRSLTGRATLTAEQKARADIAAPTNGTPDIADARMILRRAGGLQ